MTNATPGTTKTCEFCDKRGLPLLLVRDAVAPSGAGAPLSADPTIELGASAAHYTKRLVRSGYLNVFDEARKRWESYFVFADGFYSKLTQTPGVIAVVPAKPFNCPDQGHRAIASCITISDPKNATKVWIGFSDVLWTDAVRKKHADAAYRKRHMVAIDVKAALGGNAGPHTRPIAQLSAVVAEYAMNATKGLASFKFSPFQFNPRHDQAERLRKEFDALRVGKGLIVTVPDPVGIAQELAMLMTRNADLFAGNLENRRKLAVSSQINEIETAVRVAAEHRKIEKFDEDKSLATGRVAGRGGFPSQAAKHRELTAKELQEASDDAWENYAKKLNNTERRKWVQSFQTRLKAFDSKFIAPLALGHAKWMTSAAMTSYFHCNFDPEKPESGAVYLNVFTRCVTGTQDKVACFNVYHEWISGDVADSDNLLLRAMVLNQKIVADAIVKATTVAVDARSLPLDNVFAIYSTAVKRVGDGGAEAASRLLVQVTGPFARAIGKVLDGTAHFRQLVMLTGLIAGHPIMSAQVTGNVKEFRAHVVTQLLLASGKVVDKKQLLAAVKAELRRLDIKGVPMSGTAKKAFLAPIDLDAIKRIPNSASSSQTIEDLAKSLRTLEDVERLDLGRWRQVISKDLAFGVVAGILQAICLSKLFGDEDKALENEKFDATWRLYMGASAVGATTLELIGNTLKARAGQGLRWGQGLMAGAGVFFKAVGRASGAIVGIIMAGLDFRKFLEAVREDRPGLAFVYLGSALAGLGLTIAIWASVSIPIIGWLIAILIGLALLIEYFKDNPVQDWLERTLWGILVDQRYPDFETEQAQLKLATKE